jgi:uncharacterized membrane protein
MSKTQKKESSTPQKNSRDEVDESSIPIPETIRSLLAKASLRPGERKQIEIVLASYFKGPLPPPDLLREYNSVVNEGAERIFDKFEQQANHRMEMEKLVLTEQLRQSSKGQWFGFIISMFGLALAGLMTWLGYETLGITLASTTIISLTTIFVIGKRSQAKEVNE